MIYSLHRFGASFEEYFIFKFYDLNADGRRKFNTLKMQYGYCELVNDSNIRNLFEDKGKCYELFKPYYKRDLLVVTSKEDKQDLIRFIELHPSFIYKPLNGHSGMGITIYRECDSKNTAEIEKIMEQGDGKFVVEELIIQAPEMAVLHKESINTIRIATFTINGKVDILGTALRVGTGKANVDNAGAGGLYAGVDPDEGIVNSVARDNKGYICLRHPDSGVVFPGFVIPEWNQALGLVKMMATTVRGATVISWDLAYSDKGWLMIEGNDVGEAYLLQAPLQTPNKQEIVRHIDIFKENKI